jgi:hypothetical protein
VNPIRERLGAIRYRLFGRCWARGCGRPLALHTPRQLDRCLDRPTALALTEEGWLLALEPVVPVSHAQPA